MKKLSAFILACALLTPAALLAADFEGKVHFKITAEKGAPKDMDYSLKNGLARIDVQTKETTASVIMDHPKQEVTILMPEQKMYLVQSIAGKGGATATAAVDAANPSFEKTGVTEKILGYACEKYLVKSNDGITELWATEELGAFLGFGPGGGGMMGGRRGGGSAAPQAWESALAGKNFFPLRVVSQNSSGKETTRIEATAVEKKTLPDTDFTPPADFKKFDLGAMMRGPTPGR